MYKEYLQKQHEYISRLVGNYVFEGDNIPEDVQIDSRGRSLVKSEYCKIHTNLLPQQVIGDIERARIFLCLLNPGFDDTNYEDETIIREELLSQLCQKNASMFWINDDEAIKNTDGARWWRRKLDQRAKDKSLVENIKSHYEKQGIELSKEDVFSLLSRIIAILELFPYHSKRAPGGIIKNLYQREQSVGKILSYVHEELIPNAVKEERIICFLRSHKEWMVTDTEKSMECVFCNPFPRNISFGMHLPLGKFIFNHIKLITGDFTTVL